MGPSLYLNNQKQIRNKNTGLAEKSGGPMGPWAHGPMGPWGPGVIITALLEATIASQGLS